MAGAISATAFVSPIF